MKKKNSIYKIALAILLTYFVLIILLYLAESRVPESQIESIWDAVWYSLVTLTTVGYGDMTPQTPVGFVIGGIFLVLSMGLLVTLMSTAFTFLTGEAWPMVMLHFLRERDWYYFCDFGPESNLMAQDIMKQDEKAVIIFGEQKDKELEVPDYPCYFVNETPARIVKLKDGHGADCKVFFMRENDIYHNIRAIDIDALPVQIYAHTTSGKEKISENMHFFHSYDCCARQYWMENLMEPDEKCVVIIGFGNFGRSILERAIMLNIFAADQHVAYHVFGDSTEFRQLHHKLDQVFSINESSQSRDMIFFHEDTWRTEYELLQRADRIIICEDKEETSWKILWMMQRYYVTKGRLFIRSNQQVVGVASFGGDELIYTCDNILRTVQNQLAIALNDRFRKIAGDDFIAWDDLDDLLKQSKMAVADHLIMKCRILLPDDDVKEVTLGVCQKAYKRFHWIKDHPGQEVFTAADKCYFTEDGTYFCRFAEVGASATRLDLATLRSIEHMRWLRYYCFYNWSYAPEADDQMHVHPMLLPFEELDEAQKASRDYSWELLRSLGE